MSKLKNFIQNWTRIDLDYKTFIITEDMCDVVVDSTKWVAPYNTSYWMTWITIKDWYWVEWREWWMYRFIISTKLVVASATRNVGIRIWTWAYIPAKNWADSILSWNSYFIKWRVDEYMYKTTYEVWWALYLCAGSDTTYSAMSASEATTWTDTTAKIITAAILKWAVQTHSPVQSVNWQTWDVSLTIPTVNNATLTIQKNGTNVQTFTANQSTNATANITVPTKVSDLSNDIGYIKSWDFQQELNAFNRTPKAFYSSLHNALYRADRTCSVTLTNVSWSSSNLFNNNYESYIQITHNSVWKILIEKDWNWILWWYSTWDLYLSFYSSREPRALNKISARWYTDYQNRWWADFWEPILIQQWVVWPNVVKLSSPHSYRLQKIEINLTEDSDKDLWITQVEFQPSRWNWIQNLSVVTKYWNSDIYWTIRADAIAKIWWTSSQFLKADWSVDSNTYITSANISDIAYAANWDWVTSVAPSKNAVYDKITAMDATIGWKANDNAVVKLTWNQTINWTKTFGTSPVVPSKIANVANTWTAIATEAQVYKILPTVMTASEYSQVSAPVAGKIYFIKKD